MNYSGIDGFLGTRASLMLDVVFLAMFAVIPIMAWSIYQVKYRARYTLHKRVQLALAVVLGMTVTAFEIDIRVNGWTERAAGQSSNELPALVMDVLYVHLFFAITTTLLWIFVIFHAMRKIPSPPGPSAASRRHIFWGKLAAVDMFMTALTGWIFYYLAFVAERLPG